MDIIITVFLLVSFLSTSAMADDYCSNRNMTWNGTKCVTVGAGVSTAVTSGIYSAKKYSRADSIEKEFTLRVFEDSSSHPGNDISSANRSSANFRNGDKITIFYNLSEAENRQYHIELMEQNAATSRSLAITYGAQALTATRTEYDTIRNSDGSTTTVSRTVPDYGARASYAALALREESNARDYLRKADEARSGGVVPTYDLEKVIDSERGTAQLASDFNKERIDRGGKILKIDRLPADKFRLVKSSISRARAGLGGVAVGTGLAIEEAIEGAAAKRIDESSDYSPKMREYDDYFDGGR